MANQSIIVDDFSYVGHRNENVPSYLVYKNGVSQGVGIIFFHPASGDRNSLIAQAKILAKHGFIVLIPDGPFRRPGFGLRKFKNSLERRIYIYQQWIEDGKYGIQILKNRSDVNPSKIASIGRNLGGGMATVLASQSEIKAVVIIGAIPSLASHAAANCAEDPDNPSSKEVFERLLPFDPLKAIAKVKAQKLIQYGLYDHYFTIDEAKEFVSESSENHLVKWYEEGHDLNSDKVQRDYLLWLLEF